MGEIFHCWQLGPAPIFPLSEFSSEEIETFHLGETGAIKVRLLQSVPLNVEWIEIQGIPAELAHRAIPEQLPWLENFIRKDKTSNNSPSRKSPAFTCYRFCLKAGVIVCGWSGDFSGYFIMSMEDTMRE